ncbi:MAG: TPM domain-containing protein [Firmicutes bacterium]|nr:TPM domain-containing protein [Bacillota bacterium]
MRKRNVFLTLLLILSLAIPSAVFATGPETATDSAVEEQEIYIYDEAGLFTEEQYQNLQEQAMSVSNYSQCGVYFIAVNHFGAYSSYDDILLAAEDIYRTNELGIGEEQNGILLLLSMNQRDYALVTYGSFAHMAFTDYGQEVMCNNFLDDFSENHWYGGVLDYILDCERMTDMALEGTPLDIQGPPDGSIYDEYYDTQDQYYGGGERSFVTAVFMAVLPSAALCLVICNVLKRQMKTARRQTDAFEYVVGNSVDFRVRQDIFTHVTHSRRKINTGGGGSKSGGGTTVRSSGFSGRSGKF